MTHCVPCSAPRGPLLAILLFGLLVGLNSLQVSAAPVMDTPRFTDNKNGTVTDNWTGLVWLQNANCTDTVGGVNKPSGYLTWANALTWTAALYSSKCNLSDGSTAGQWRLPNRNELQSLIDYTRGNPALPVDHPFTGVQSNFYWSSATYAPNTGLAWHVGLGGGAVFAIGKTYNYYVWPVRGGQ